MLKRWLWIFFLCNQIYCQVGIIDSTVQVVDTTSASVPNSVTDLFIQAQDSSIADSAKKSNPFYSDQAIAAKIDSLPITIEDSTKINFSTIDVAVDYAIEQNVSLDSAYNALQAGFAEGFNSDCFDPESPYPCNPLIADKCDGFGKFKVRDVYELDHTCIYDSIYILNTQSILAIFDKNDLIEEADSFVFDNNSRLLGTRFNLCSSERHFYQPSIAYGTAFMMDSNAVLTAAHCIRDLPIENIRFVVGYESLLKEKGFKMKIAKDRVYSIKKIIKVGDEYDYAYIETNRIISNRAIPIIKKDLDRKANSTIHCIGYPLGLPMKIIGNGKVVSRLSYGLLQVSINAYRGNSGSPIFDTLTGELIGMLIGGETDLIKTSSCNLLRICLPKQCREEIVLDINSIMNDIHGN